VVDLGAGQPHRPVRGPRGNHPAAGRLMRRAGGRIDLTAAADKVAVVDGADWIRNPIRRHNVPGDDGGLDVYHLAENVQPARRPVFGEESVEGEQGAGEGLHVVKREGDVAFWQRLVEGRARRRPQKRPAAAALRS
jgi:hypothetical protein